MSKIRYILLSATFPVVFLLGNVLKSHAQTFSQHEVVLEELEVKLTKEKYTKKNNPAVELQRNIRRSADDSDPWRLPHFSYDVYEKIGFAINDFNAPSGALSFLGEYVDSSGLSGKPILNISLKEKIATIDCDTKTHRRCENVIWNRNQGLDDFVDQASMATLLKDVLREVDIFSHDINILQNRFVSPLSPLGPDFYKYYITDSLEVDGEKCIELSFVPRTSESFGFTGKLFVTADSTYFVKRAIMGIPRDINLNFVDKMRLEQRFERDSIGTRVKLTDDMIVELSVIPGTQGMMMTRNSLYAPAGTFDDERPMPLTSSEAKMAEMIARLRNNTTYRRAERILRILVNGYIPTASSDSLSRIDIGPWNTLISGNEVEGTRLRFGATTTTVLSNRWFGKGYIAYGTKDKQIKYGAEIEYSFRDKNRHAREFPVHSIALSHNYDVDMLGQHYLYTNQDNFVLSWTRIKNRLMTYRRITQLKYTLEMDNNFSLQASVANERQEQGPYLPFITTSGTTHTHYNETTLNITLRYAPGEQFFQTRTQRIPINQDAPVFTLSHTYGPAGFPGNTFEINKTEMSAKKRFWFSGFGYMDCAVTAGHVWSRSPYPSLLIPNANLSYTIQPESFALMDPMEFISDSYASWYMTYWANGAILNYIPLIKKLRLREVFSFSGYIGDLSRHNTPTVDNNLYAFPSIARATPMHGRPYMELSAGIDNLLRIFRIDYVWRLTYRNTPGVDRSGVRVALHITF